MSLSRRIIVVRDEYINKNWNDGSLRESRQQVTDDRKSAVDDEFKVRQSTEKRENVNVKKMKVASD